SCLYQGLDTQDYRPLACTDPQFLIRSFRTTRILTVQFLQVLVQSLGESHWSMFTSSRNLLHIHILTHAVLPALFNRCSSMRYSMLHPSDHYRSGWRAFEAFGLMLRAFVPHSS